ncbi:S4 domain protein [Actinomyces sp. Chiba101]|uniref:Ribosome-associated protein n=2 Tax=Actinomycetaceae TaxID=2049 RepID=A0ABY1IDC0_9ACTO|nr:S4 domain protein [Actinomyces sp. Chiba101]GAV94166.1 hypothetical protein ADENT20671_0934 [Actinomyces denticolens]SHI99934.1 ribosome-associated protein [Actinomyces denticolens]SUU06589.1 ribosome-associated protein [Actinomyces denticolens]
MRTTSHTCHNRIMSDTPCHTILVRGEIKLGQFLKLADLVEDGAEARIAIQSGDVSVNGEVERRRGHRLSDGDLVTVDLPSGSAEARVRVET